MQQEHEVRPPTQEERLLSAFEANPYTFLSTQVLSGVIDIPYTNPRRRTHMSV